MKIMTWRRILFGPKLMIVGLWIASAVSTQSQTFQVVASLPASLDGTPSSLTQGTNGNLYGTTAGVEFSSNGGVFEYTPQGRLVGFLTLNGTYDANPAAGVTLDGIGRAGRIWHSISNYSCGPVDHTRQFQRYEWLVSSSGPHPRQRWKFLWHDLDWWHHPGLCR